MSYQILRTEHADNQLREIIFYIAEDSGDIDIALKFLNRFEKALIQLETFPYIGTRPRYPILKKQGYRVLIIERYLVFYKVREDEKTVIIYAIFDGRQEYKNLV